MGKQAQMQRPLHEQWMRDHAKELLAFGMAHGFMEGRGLVAVSECSNEPDIVYIPLASIEADSDPGLLELLNIYDVRWSAVVACPKVKSQTPYYRVIEFPRGQN